MAELMIIEIEGTKYTFDPNHVGNDEAMAIERVTAGTFTQWTDALTAGSVTALTALVWILQRRDNPKAKFADVRFDMGEFDVEWVDNTPPVEDADEDGASESVNPTPVVEATPSDETPT
jgi:hypothetical protein